MSVAGALWGAVRASCKDGGKVWVNLYKVMVPLIVFIKVMNELGLIKYLAMPLEPLMTLMGLPADFGIVWAAGMVVNLYSAFIVMASLLPGMDTLSVGQMSIFGLMLLYAHSLPIEGRIAQQCGVSFIGQVTLRIGVALVTGIGLHMVLSRTGWLSSPATILLALDAPNPTLGQWAWNEVRNSLMVLAIIVTLLLVQRGIDHFNITRWLELVLKPLLLVIGVSSKAATTILVGMCMGLIYGSGLIIRAANDGSLNRRDIFGSVTLMGLAHAIIEDTLLMLVVGSDWFVILVVRSAVAIAVGAFVIRLWGRLAPVAGKDDAPGNAV